MTMMMVVVIIIIMMVLVVVVVAVAVVSMMIKRCIEFVFCFWCNRPQWARASSFKKFLDHTQRRTTVGRTPLEE